MFTTISIIISVITINTYILFNHKHKKFVKDNWKIIRQHFLKEHIHISLREDHCELDFSIKHIHYHINLSYKQVHNLYDNSQNNNIQKELIKFIKEDNI